MQCLVSCDLCLFYKSLITPNRSERALEYRSAVDRYARVYKHDRLTAVEWMAIETVARWLWLYRDATQHMSSTKETMLSAVYSVFTELQEDLCNQLHRLDTTLPVELGVGLQEALDKLSKYFGKTDASPYL
jgi:hypothetical protein